MLVAFVLLAVLMIGAVSASDDSDFNQALTAENVDEVSVDASVDSEVISDSGGDEILTSENNNVIIHFEC